MQNLLLNNVPLAKEYLLTAYRQCATDPLLLNEMGVCAYYEDDMPTAIQYFTEALRLAAAIDTDSDFDVDDGTTADPQHRRSPPIDAAAITAATPSAALESSTLLPTRANLAHALRRIGHYDLALANFSLVLRRGGKDAGIFAAKGLCLLELGRCWDAVVVLHEALAVAPQDGVATELLSRALDALGDEGGVVNEGGGRGEVVGEEEFERGLQAAREKILGRHTRGRRDAGGGSSRGRGKERQVVSSPPPPAEEDENGFEDGGGMESPPEAEAVDYSVEDESMMVDTDED